MALVLAGRIKMNFKRAISALLCGALVMGMAAGCSSDPDAGKETSASQSAAQGESAAATEAAAEEATQAKAEATGVTLEVETTWTAEKLEALQKLMDDFTAETGIGVELVAPGDDYENVMKTRMASNDMPDLFETHGWSTTRYKEYLTALDDQAWLSGVKDDIKETVTAEDGSVYVVPLSIDPASICYNKEIFEQAGVEAGEIRTWADFEAACEKIKALGIVPVYVGGNSVNNIANLFEVAAPGYLTNEDVADNQGAALLGGSFDWDAHWTPIAQMFAGWLEKGYVNTDILTASDDSSLQALANGEGAIVISGNHTITSALTYNPDAQLGILPIPSPYEGGKVYVSSGEGTCYGIWKDTEYPEEAKRLIDYLARPEVCNEIATVNGKIPGFKDVSNEEAYVTKAFDEMQSTFGGDLIFIQYFDREYLPSGMWNDMGVSGTEVFMDPAGGVQKCVDSIRTAFEEKFGA